MKDELINRLENLKDKYPNFYKEHPDLLEQLNKKIDAIKNDNYEIKDAGYVVAYIGGNVTNTQMYTNKNKNKEFTIEDAKILYEEFKK